MPTDTRPAKKSRRSLRRVVGASNHRLHYYAKCVAILSKAKPWERVRVVKALCLLVGLNRPNAGTQRPGSPDGSLATETRKPGSLK